MLFECHAYILQVVVQAVAEELILLMQLEEGKQVSLAQLVVAIHVE